MSLLGTAVAAMSGSADRAILILNKTKSIQEVNSTDVAEKAREQLADPSMLSVLPTATSTAISAFAVQYNPSSISIQANADHQRFAHVQQDEGNGVVNQNVRAPMVMLEVELLLDAVSVPDSFMLEYYKMTIGRAATALASLGGDTREFSVAEHTRALLGLLLYSDNSCTTFAWGDMAFTGEVTGATAEYIMFSYSGQPVRSKVKLKIAQAIGSSADSAYWNGAVNKVFTATGSLATAGGRKKSESLGNMINLTGLV